MSLIDILFIITVALLVFNGFRNGAVFSLVSLLGIPIGLIVAYVYGPQFTNLLAANGFAATPLISYCILFFGVVFLVHFIGNLMRGVVRSVPLISQGDTLLGGAIGFVEAWLIWLLLLIALGSFLSGVQHSIQSATVIPGMSIQFDQFKTWHDFYNQVVTNSLFAKVNGFFVRTLPEVQSFH